MPVVPQDLGVEVRLLHSSPEAASHGVVMKGTSMLHYHPTHRVYTPLVMTHQPMPKNTSPSSPTARLSHQTDFIRVSAATADNEIATWMRATEWANSWCAPALCSDSRSRFCAS